jgi:hypothetical protein
MKINAYLRRPLNREGYVISLFLGFYTRKNALFYICQQQKHPHRNASILVKLN